MKKYRVSEGQIVFSPSDQIKIYMSHQQHVAGCKPLRDIHNFPKYVWYSVQQSNQSPLFIKPALLSLWLQALFGNNWILFIKSLPKFTIENMRIIFKIAEGRIVGTTQFWWLWMVYITRSTVHRYNCFESMNDFKPEPRNPIYFIARNVTYDGVRY